jgi:hypothetical protein
MTPVIADKAIAQNVHQARLVSLNAIRAAWIIGSHIAVGCVKCRRSNLSRVGEQARAKLLAAEFLTLRTWAQKRREIRRNHVAAVRTDEVVVLPNHRFELVAFDAVRASFDLHGPGPKIP